MSIVADLHLHSAYARACSKELNFENNSIWAKYKGIDLLSSADFTHPVWWEETKKKLKEKGNGFFEHGGVDFVLGGEVSVVYSQNGSGRRVHLLLYAPDFATVEKINKELGKRGKLASDGRPILGLTSQNIAQIVFEANPDSLIIPAHVWTPWFGLYGSKSGFDSIEECFGEYASKIYAIETGLSSDPVMNWQIPELDKRSIVSFSDAHSLPKMGRELTVFQGKGDPPAGGWGYLDLVRALKNQEIDYTVEFYPEEGKYHYTGHRSCDVSLSPEQTKNQGEICPSCGKKLTVGVLHQVESLGGRSLSEIGVVKDGLFHKPSHQPRPPYISLVALQEIVAEALAKPVASPHVRSHYLNLVKELNHELFILTEADLEAIAIKSHPRIAEGVSRVRNGQIVIDPGYDGIYGIVKIWPETKTVRKVDPVKKPKAKKESGQINLFE